MKTLEVTLRAVRDARRKALVPYFMGGLTPDWVHHVQAAIHAGADAVEIGIPFSDPMIDGVIIQEAAQRSLRAGTTLASICSDLAALETTVPCVAMTYYNVVLHYGLERAAGTLHDSGISGAIVPDLSLEEADAWIEVCDPRDVATVFLVAPSTSAQRIEQIAAKTQGFVYASARMAVTGPAADIGDAQRVVQAIRATSDIPALVGIGIATPALAEMAAGVSDGVIVGAALVRLILDGAGPPEIESFVSSFRRAID